MLFFGVLGKFGALFTTIPDPIVGGVFMVMFGMITAVGISNLQFVDMNSPRNLFIIGFSLILGMALPHWMNKNPDAIQTGMRTGVGVLCKPQGGRDGRTGRKIWHHVKTARTK